MSEPIRVDHALGSYPITIAPGNLERLGSILAEHAGGRRIAVITDRNVARAVPLPIKAATLVIPPGEGSKTRSRWATLTNRLLDLGFGRDSVIAAVGGGVVGDLAGFVAATFMRGVPYLQVPTSLLAMVDASVGGKTGVNTRHGKNLVGAFHQPIGVLIDPAVLSTLRSRHLRNGLVEAVKHGLVADANYYEWIDRKRTGLLARDPALLETLVRRSLEIKTSIVAEDEREAGRRAVLNAGHTVGHALERLARFAVTHGEAVALGLVVEASLSERLDQAPSGLAEGLAQRLRSLGFRLRLPPQEADDALVDHMRHDKKSTKSALVCSLPRQPGALAQAPPWTTVVEPDDVRQSLGNVRSLI